jgi:SET domain-containing protein
MSKGERGRLSERVCRAQSPIHGFGCFARIPFRAGDYIGTFRGPQVTEDGAFVLWVYDPEGQGLSAREGSNLLRWLNHSEDPNAELDLFRLYARRGIAAGEEITIDYGAGAGAGACAEPASA